MSFSSSSSHRIVTIIELYCISIPEIGNMVGHGGALVETMTFNRRIVGSTPVLIATKGPFASPLLTVVCALRRETPIQYPCPQSGADLSIVEDLKGRYRNGQNE